MTRDRFEPKTAIQLFLPCVRFDGFSAVLAALSRPQNLPLDQKEGNDWNWVLSGIASLELDG